MRILSTLVTAIVFSSLAGCATQSVAPRHGDTAVRAEPRRISEGSWSSVNEPAAAPERTQRVLRF
jgi:hypothetical protein